MNVVFSLKNLLFAYSPFVKTDKKQLIRLRKIIKELNSKFSFFFNPVQMYFNPRFAEQLIKISNSADILIPLYSGNLNGSKETYINFIKKITESLLSMKKLTLESYSFESVLKQAKAEQNTDLDYIDGIFKSRLNFFKNNIFEKMNKSILSNTIAADLTSYNYEAVISMFYSGKKSKLTRLSAENIEKDLEDLWYLLSALEQIDIDENDLFVKSASAQSAEAKELNIVHLEMEKMLSALNVLYEENFIPDVLKLLNKNPDYEPDKKRYKVTYPKEIYDTIVNQYQKHRQHYIQKLFQQKLRLHLKQLFSDIQLLNIDGYDTEISSLLTNSKAPGFSYIVPMQICKTFSKLFVRQDYYSAFKEFIIDADFSVEKLSTEMNDMIEALIMVDEKIDKFEEDLNTPAFSELNPYLKMLRSGIISGKDRVKANQAVENLNERADKIIQQSFATAQQSHMYLTSLIEDIDSKHPQLLYNAHFIIHKKSELLTTLKTAEKSFANFIRLLKLYSVQINDIKKKLKTP